LLIYKASQLQETFACNRIGYGTLKINGVNVTQYKQAILCSLEIVLEIVQKTLFQLIHINV